MNKQAYNFDYIRRKWMREAGIVEDSYVSVTVIEGLLLIRRVQSEVG